MATLPENVGAVAGTMLGVTVQPASNSARHTTLRRAIGADLLNVALGDMGIH